MKILLISTNRELIERISGEMHESGFSLESAASRMG